MRRGSALTLPARIHRTGALPSCGCSSRAVSEGTFSVKADDICSVLVSPQTLQEQVATDGTLLAFTVHRGSRSKTFYLTDTAPNLTLQLLNEFLVPEYIHLRCVTKTKLSPDRSLATSQGSLSFYDDTSADEYESETAMLTLYEARRLSRLLLSSTIKAALTDIGTSLPISIPNPQFPLSSPTSPPTSPMPTTPPTPSSSSGSTAHPNSLTPSHTPPTSSTTPSHGRSISAPLAHLSSLFTLNSSL